MFDPLLYFRLMVAEIAKRVEDLGQGQVRQPTRDLLGACPVATALQWRGLACAFFDDGLTTQDLVVGDDITMGRCSHQFASRQTIMDSVRASLQRRALVSAFFLQLPGFLDVSFHILAQLSAFRFDFLGACGAQLGRLAVSPDPFHHLPERIVLR